MTGPRKFDEYAGVTNKLATIKPDSTVFIESIRSSTKSSQLKDLISDLTSLFNKI